MTMLDMFVLALVGGGALLGAIRGFTTEMLALLAWVAAIAALKLLHGPVSGMMGDGVTGSVLAFLLLAGGTFFGVRLVARSFGGTVKRSMIGGVDRGLGFGFGGLKGLVIATLAFLLVTLVTDTLWGSAHRPHWMTASRSYMLLDASGRAIVDFVDRRRDDAGDAKANESST